MKYKPYIVLVVFAIGFVTAGYGQHPIYQIRNGFGITAGVTQYNIITDNFETESSIGWIGGISATADLPHKWYTISYGMLFSQNYLEVSGRMTDDVAGNEMLKYKLMTVQLGLIFHAKIIGDNLTFDFGPQFQYNDKLRLEDSSKESYFINGYDAVSALDITEISKANFNGLAGFSGGFGAFKIRAWYTYGFTNILNKLNDRNIDTGESSEKFKGNQSMIAAAIQFSF